MSAELRFGNAVIYVDDLPAAMDFYRRALGLEPRFYDADAEVAGIHASAYAPKAIALTWIKEEYSLEPKCRELRVKVRSSRRKSLTTAQR